MSHRCHWTGCKENVPPHLWGCKKHWYMLPARIRQEIWRTYVPGQEVRKDPSDDYLHAAALATKWIHENYVHPVPAV